MMLARSPSAAAIRSRERRARQRAGSKHDLHVRMKTSRLVAALKAANPLLPARELTVGEIEAEVESVLEALCVRWLGPPK